MPNAIKLVPMTKENLACSISRFGYSPRFQAWNGEVYAACSLGIVPAKQSTRYASAKQIIDSAIEDLKGRTNGSYIFITKGISPRWLSVPLCLVERMAISKFDESAIENLPADCPLTFIIPV